MTGVIVKTQFEGIHYYAGAPEEVAFLRTPHRHIFYVEVEMEVMHNDRELEFILVKRDLEKQFNGNCDHKSCEMLAKEIQTYLKNKYPICGGYVFERKINVKVLEDNENGGFVREF